VDVSSLAVDQDLSIEVAVEQPDSTRPVLVDGNLLLPDTIPRDRKVLHVASGSSSTLNFEIHGLPIGLHHGRVSLSTEDGLAIDNTRYFTVNMQSPMTVLLAASPGADPRYVESVLSPYEMRLQGQAAFDCQTIDADGLVDRPLADYDIIGVLDPRPLSVAHWKALKQFVQQGGGLALCLGRNAVPMEAFNEFAGDLLPGKLRMQWRTAEGEVLFLAAQNMSHPILSLFRGRESVVPWDEYPIYRHWMLDVLQPGTSIVMRYSNQQPAILESIVGAGRLITVTTPFSDPTNEPERPEWNRLPTGEEPWPFFALTMELFRHLGHASAPRWNYLTGEVATVLLPSVTTEETWQLLTPSGDWQNVRPRDSAIQVSETEAVGTYRLRGPRADEAPSGFSVNLPEPATDVARLDVKQLDEILGPGRYTLTRGPEELKRGIGQARVGRELFPFLTLVVAGVLIMELLLANRFYAAQGSRKG
jgi:hypothetical protein